ncbi:MAG: DUF4494 domain-containing protein [Muribaculaceae bacterium]|nr:DUF4494 domain-containing protein [Muribaculaceae bacterium]
MNMSLYFEVKATYDKMTENGLVKKVTEPYLFDALSFTEAESRAIEELTPFISGEFTVKACKRTPIAEIFNLGAERYYLAKVAFITIDEKTAQEKRSISQILVGASDFKEAYDNFLDGMKGTMADFELVSLAETPIMDVYPAKLS